MLGAQAWQLQKVWNLRMSSAHKPEMCPDLQAEATVGKQMAGGSRSPRHQSPDWSCLVSRCSLVALNRAEGMSHLRYSWPAPKPHNP